MIVVLKGTQRREHSRYFERMFRLRHDIFIKGLGWPLPSRNGLEIDEYDVDEAVYLLDVTHDDVIQGSVRLLPSVRCSLVDDYFPHWIENGLPARDPFVWECTRYIFVPLKACTSNRAARARILSAMVDSCRVNRMTHVQCVVDMRAFPGFVEMAPQAIPLGLPHPYGGGPHAPGGGECIAFRWPATREVVDSIRTHGGLEANDALPFPANSSPEPVELTH